MDTIIIEAELVELRKDLKDYELDDIYNMDKIGGF